MQILTVILIFLAIVLASLLVYFQYYFNEKSYNSKWVLAFLRFVSVFSILLLLINPKFKSKSYVVVKPKLLIAVDNSSSIVFAKQDSLAKNIVNKITANKSLQDKFEISYFSFGKSLKNNKNFNFQESQTNIYRALKEINKVNKDQTAPIILITDGNQTYGNDYKYVDSKQAIYPIIIGDTMQYADYEIQQIHVNKYAHLDNNFEVEIFVNFLGVENRDTQLLVEKNGKTVYSKRVSFLVNKKSEHVTFKLPANNIGKHLYKVHIKPFKNEKNTINNYKNFSIEVIDEQTKVALVYDVLHPDIGMIKRTIETNKQRKVNLINLNKFDDYNIDNDVFILYQPNYKFDKIFSLIDQENKNCFIITGKSTGWNFLNNVQDNFKKVTASSFESFTANYNSNFNSFYTEDIGFSEFPPLEDVFGEIKLSVPYQSILMQKINGVSTNKPLLVAISDNNKREVVLFGENSWKWRTWSFSETQSFTKFDQFFNSLIQFLSITKNTEPINLSCQTSYYANEPVIITAKTYDSNLNFDVNANLKLFIEDNKNGIPFNLNKGVYEVQLSDLKSGDYSFIVKNIHNSNQTKGFFTVGEYAVEHKLTTANKLGLNTLALNSNGKSYYPNQLENLMTFLSKNSDFNSVEKENKKMVSFVDWQWILSLIILSLSLEWFIRKYWGLI